jgi:peptidase M3-like protein
MSRTPYVPVKWFCAVLALWSASGSPAVAEHAASPDLPQLESAYADFNDAAGAVGLIDSRPARYADQGYGGRSRARWVQLYRTRRSQLLSGLKQLEVSGLSASDRRAVTLMRQALKESASTPESLAPVGHCTDAQRHDLPLRAQQQALYACFAELGNHLPFENSTVTRVDALGLLTSIPDPERRRTLFLAFEPLWHALNGNDGRDSPYRRMIRQAAAKSHRDRSPVELAARTVGVSAEEPERWLELILDTWRQVSGDSAIEPWDYRFQADIGVRSLSELVPVDGMQQLNQRYYLDLGLDLAAMRVIYDLEPRSGKAPLAYTDFVVRGRQHQGAWQPTIVRVSANYTRASLGELNELVHENGHAAHMLALRTRPAFMDLGDPIFYEAFADVPSWSVYEPAWQRKYLGRSASERDSLRALYANVILDVAWALFDMRMLRNPDTDPNRLWTDITQHYLHIRPHPEFSWWALRVQLVDVPGYMVNYGLGSVITADLRQRITQELGPFQTGEPRWFPWLGQHLLASGEQHPTSQLLREFLGRPVSPEALLSQLRRLSASDKE